MGRKRGREYRSEMREGKGRGEREVMQREARGEREVREMLETGVRKRGCGVMK